MGHVEQTLKGPDLKKGIDTESLKSGEKILGHADGIPVLLIRSDKVFYAIGAKCSHYSADLGEGLLVDHEIRCPWHHACFDIKTGVALKAPAFNPIPTWHTEVKAGKVYVLEQRTPPTNFADGKKVSEHFVIVGSGAAGHMAAETLRRLNFAGQVTLLSSDRDIPYDRPNLSKDYLAGNAPEEWMPLRSSEFFSEQKINLRLEAKVKKIDPKAKSLTLENGESIGFDKCLIATGGTPLRPRIEGIGLPHVHFLRSFADCRALIENLKSAKKVAIVGAGFIGLEAAAALRARKLDVSIIAPGKFPLEHVVGSEAGEFLKSLHESNGVQFHLGKSVEKIEKGRVVLNDKTDIAADIVLVATGIALSADFAQGSGMEFKDGFLVNEYLETSAQGVFAAGDIARYPSAFSPDLIRTEHWVVAQRQGQIAAANMVGFKKKYSDVPFFWSQQFDVVLNYVGRASSTDSTRVYGKVADRNFAVAFLEGKKVKAVLTVGRDLQSLELEKALEKQDQNLLRSILEEGR